MAVEKFKNGKDYPVFILLNEDYPITNELPPEPSNPAWKQMVCLSTNALSVTINGIDTTTKCTDGWADSIPGDGSWEVTADGNAVNPDGDDKVSADEIFDLATEKVSFWAAIFDPLNETYRVGVAYFSSFSESFNNNEAYTFSATLTGRGKVYRSATT